MHRFIDAYLEEWRQSPRRKPMILRGARQVGKTHAVRRFGENFDQFIEINLELMKSARAFFQKSLEPDWLLRQIGLLVGEEIVPGKALLFLDEVQEEPQAIIALRYFYEKMPDLHVIAAGSLLDFAIANVGVPVGRVSYYYMYPLSFVEFLCALGHPLLAEEVITHHANDPMSAPIHDKLLDLVGEYIAVGGMPESVISWRDSQSLVEASLAQNEIIDTYIEDFPKYATKAKIKYVDLVFKNLPRQLASTFKTSHLDGNYRKRELAPAVDLLEKAKVIWKVCHSAAQGTPLAAQMHPDKYKLILLDVAITQTLLGNQLKDWLLSPHQQYVNKGQIVESFVGQEIISYTDPRRPAELFYWQSGPRSTAAEVDYVFSKDQLVIPIEVKSDKGTSLKSMRRFLESHQQSPFGVRFSTHNYSVYDQIHSYPLYAVAGFCAANKDALLKLTRSYVC